MEMAILALQLGVIIFAAKFCGDLAKKCKMPSVLGELLAGILIGPYLLGRVGIPLEGLCNGLFPLNNGELFSQRYQNLYAFSTVGSIILLFMSGLETDLRMFFRYSVAGTLVGIGGVVFSFAFGDFLGTVLLHSGFMDPRCLFLGILCTATSVGITARILSERRQIDSPEGVTILAAAVIDDVLGIVCLAIVMGIVTLSSDGVQWGAIGAIALKSFGIWLGATVLGLLLARHIAKFLRIYANPTIFATLSLGFSLLVAGLFEEAGLAMIIGAYVMGLSLSKTDVSFAIRPKLEVLYAFLVPVFFVVMGMLVDIRVFLDSEVLCYGLIYSVLAVLAKVIGCALPSLFMNFNTVGALRIGCGMIPRGEVALIIGGIGAVTPMFLNGEKIMILDAKLFGIAIIMTIATTLLAPPILTCVLNIKKKGVRKEVKDVTSAHVDFDCPSETILKLVVDKLYSRFESEGFLMSSLDKETGMMHLRYDNLSFTMTVHQGGISFEIVPEEVVYIRSILYETVVDLHHTLEKLKTLAKPDEIQREIFVADTKGTAKSNGDAALIERHLSPKCIIMNLKAETKEDVYAEMINLLKSETGAVTDRDLCLKDVLDRENVVTTCLQDGLAMPHAKTDGVSAMVTAVGIRREGYAFNAMDGKPTKIFFLCLCPKEAYSPYIKFIAAITKVLTKPGKLQSAIEAPTPARLLAVLEGKE